MKKQDLEKILVQYGKEFDIPLTTLTGGDVIRAAERSSMVNLEVDPECYSKTIIQIISFYRIKLLTEQKVITPAEENKLIRIYQKYLKLEKETEEMSLDQLMNNNTFYSNQISKKESEMEGIKLLLNQYHILDSINFIDMVKTDFLLKIYHEEVKKSSKVYESAIQREDDDIDRAILSLDKHVKQKK